MKLNVHVAPCDLLSTNQRVFQGDATNEDTLKQFKHRLASQFSCPELDEFYFIWAGSVFPDTTRLCDIALKSSYNVCLIPPSTILEGASIEYLRIFQNLQYHYPPNSNQQNNDSLVALVECFTADLLRSDAPWKPEKEHVENLRWVISVLRNAASPSINNPAVRWFGEYGCALLARQTQVEDVVLTLICLDNWSFNIHSGPKSRGHNSFPCDRQATALFVGFVPLPNYKGFLENVTEKLRKVQERKKKDRTSATGKQGHHKTPGMIQAILLSALRKFRNEHESEYQSDDDDIIPKGGFTDVGLHTGGKARNTSWNLVLGVVYHLLDSKNANELFSQILLQLPIRMAEHCVKHFLLEVKDPSSDLSRNSETCRRLTDSIMQTLCHISQIAEDFASIDIYGPDFVMLEARCIRVRYELGRAVEARAKRVAKDYMLSNLSPSNVRFRDVTLSIPAEGYVQEYNNTEDIRKMACSNLSLLPVPPSEDAGWGEIEEWMNTHCSSYEGNYVKQQIICHAVENFFFRKVRDFRLSSAKTVESIMDLYRTVARELQMCDESRALPRVELLSKELLVVWICFCLVHRVAKNSYPLLARYSVSLCADDLRFLILSERSAVDAALQVSQYLQESISQEGPVFSCLKADKTMEFALKCRNKEPNIELIWEKEAQDMRRRQADRWEEIQLKKEKLERLDKEVKDLKDELNEVASKRRSLREEWDEMNMLPYRHVPKPQTLKDAEQEEKSLEGQVLNMKKEIRTAEQAPFPLFQPLPQHKNLATVILFFLYMPPDLQVLSRLSFTAHQMLLPWQNEVSVNTSPGNVTKFNIDAIIGTNPPETTWYDYFVSRSAIQAHRTSATQTKVLLGACNSIPQAEWYGSRNVRHISSPWDGVWYPDSLKPCLFWKGGDCKLDTRSKECYFDPFKDLPPFIGMYKFTEKLSTLGEPEPLKDSLQWALYQGGEDTAETRGNFSLSSQNRAFSWLRSKNEFLYFCNMRAYPLQQVRRLCATISSRGLPLMIKQIQILMQHSIHQLGHISNDGSIEREWHTDLNKFDGWASLRTILADLAEELLSKSREHSSILTVGALAAQASQWDAGCREVARKFATIAVEAAEELIEVECKSDFRSGHFIRARRCILYMSCLICHSAGELSRDDIAQMCKALVMGDYTRVFEDPTSYDEEIRALTNVTMGVVASRMSDILKRVEADPQILSDSVRNVHHAAPVEMSWELLRSPNRARTTCWHSKGIDGHYYSIDLQIGTVLVDGRPPSRLPKSILSSPLYLRSFGDRNFEVVRKRGNIFATTRSVGGYFYEFRETANGVCVKEIEESDSSVSFELLDAIEVDSWGSDLPKRLKKMYSHWLCRETNIIFLRPKYFRDRHVHYILTRDVDGARENASYNGQESSVLSDQEKWSCLRIPIHLRKKDWLGRDLNLSNLNRLVYLTDPSSQRVLRILEKFERTQGCIQTFQTPQNSFLITLPRYGLEFELTEDGCLRSNSFSSHKLRDMQNFNDTLMGFSEYLILESKGVLKVLIPSGYVRKNGSTISISGSEEIDVMRGFHVYQVHPRFETLDAVLGKLSIEARLQLAALYAATGTLLPEKRIGETGGEYAMVLIRQSWKNSPMSPSEVHHLRSIRSFGQLYPALSLLAYELFTSSQQLSFLSFDIEQASESISLDIEASSEYILRKKRLQLSPRVLLTDDEENYLLDCGIARSLQKRKPYGRDVEIMNAVSANTIMGNIRCLLKRMICSQKKDVNSLPEFPFETNAFRSTSISTKIAADLRESWSEFVRLPTQKLAHVNHELTKEQLWACLGICSDSRMAMEKAILHSLGMVHGNRVEISCFNIRRAANLEAQGTQKDLLKISCDLGRTVLFNPFLSDDSCEKIRVRILEWMQLCVMEDKLYRMCREIEENNIAEVIRELKEVDRSWDIAEHPSWLAFEVEEQLQIRDLQYKVADFCLQNPGKIT